MSESSENRRPIASRESGWAKRLASFLAKKNISPNLISIFSILFSIVSFIAFYLDATTGNYHALFMVLAVAGIQGRLVMNLLDGMVAIEHDKKSAVGGLFNEVPDRVSDTFSLLGVGFLVANEPYGMDLTYAAIILAVATAYIRTLGASLNCGHHFLGPMAKQHRMALLSAGCIAGIWYQPVFYYLLIVMNIGLVITCYRRLAKVASLLNQGAIKSK